MRPMEHSIAAKYAARTTASFPRPSARSRERRLGLRSAIAFRATSSRSTVLSGETSPARAPWRALGPATATSAGGIVISFEGGVPSLVVGLRRRDGARRRGTWTLPKGTPDPGETMEQTALRAVQAETGLQVRILGPFTSISYA